MLRGFGLFVFGVLGGGCVFGIAFNCKKARAGVGVIGMADGLPGVVAVLRSGAFSAVAFGLVCRVFRWCFE